MEENSLPESRVNLRRLRVAMLLPVAWFVLGIILPTFVMGVLDRQPTWLENLLEGIGILLLGASLIFFLVQIRRERRVARIVFAGMGFLLLSMVLRTERTGHFIIEDLSPFGSALFRQFEIALNGLGFVAFLIAFFAAVVDLLAIRQQLIAQQARLSQEIDSGQRAREEYETILHTAMDGFWVVDMQGRFLDVNDAYCQFIGYSHEELLNMRIQDVEALESPEEVAAHIEQTQNKGLDRFETRHRRKDGIIIDVEVSTNHLSGSADRQYVFLRDITERKRAEETLQRNEKRMAADLHAMTRLQKIGSAFVTATSMQEVLDELVDAAIAIANADMGSIRLIDSESGRLTIAASRGFDQSWVDSWNSPRANPDIDAKALGRGEHVIVEDITQSPLCQHGPALDVYLEAGIRAVHSIPLVGSDGKPFGLLSAYSRTPRLPDESTLSLMGLLARLATDILERANTERVMEEQRVRMIESTRLSSLGTMAGEVAHEINNPLAVIAGCAEQIKNLAADPDTPPVTMKRLAEMVHRNVTRIQKIILGLRKLSRDGSGELFSPTPVSNIIAEVLELCQERFRVHGVEIECAGASPSLSIDCRASQIAQVVLNLINNSLEAVENLPEKWVRLETADWGDRVEISVTDSGAGIPQKVSDHLFIPFFTTKFGQHGLGLGLSISRAIVEAHHGQIALDASSVNTRFVVRLPKYQPTTNSGKH